MCDTNWCTFCDNAISPYSVSCCCCCVIKKVTKSKIGFALLFRRMLKTRCLTSSSYAWIWLCWSSRISSCGNNGYLLQKKIFYSITHLFHFQSTSQTFNSSFLISFLILFFIIQFFSWRSSPWTFHNSLLSTKASSCFSNSFYGTTQSSYASFLTLSLLFSLFVYTTCSSLFKLLYVFIFYFNRAHPIYIRNAPPLFIYHIICKEEETFSIKKKQFINTPPFTAWFLIN